MGAGCFAAVTPVSAPATVATIPGIPAGTARELSLGPFVRPVTPGRPRAVPIPEMPADAPRDSLLAFVPPLASRPRVTLVPGWGRRSPGVDRPFGRRARVCPLVVLAPSVLCVA